MIQYEMCSGWKWKLYCWKCRLSNILHKWLIKKGVPICHGNPGGPCFHFGKPRRQMTEYHEEGKNWVIACEKCIVIINKYWEERWQEYWRSVL